MTLSLILKIFNHGAGLLPMRSLYGNIVGLIKDPIAWRKNYLRDKTTLLTIAKNSVLNNRYLGESCFILGNGKSLNKIDLRQLRDRYTFVVNNFISHKDIEFMNPTFYVSMEPFNSLCRSGKNNYFHPNNYYRLIDTKLYNCSTILFFNIDSKEYIESNHLFTNKKIYYISTTLGIMQAEKKGHRDDITSHITFGDSVVMASICISHYLGFREIYLLGCDEDAHITGRIDHFYKVPKAPILKSSRDTLTKEHSYNFVRWNIIKKYFDKKGVKIFNAGIGGYLEAFPRLQFTKLVRSKL